MTVNQDALSPSLPPVRPSARFMLRHPLHLISLGMGSGLSPLAPGTVGTLWAWLAFVVLQRWLGELQWAWVLALGAPLCVWASTHTARQLRTADPSAIVCDEIIAFWLVLWVIMPTGFLGQALAFALFRYFDAAKPGPVRWADQCFKAEPQDIGWRQGVGIVLDDLVAAACTLLVFAVVRAVW